MECVAASHHEALSNINRVGVSRQDMLAVADATTAAIDACPDAVAKPVNRDVIEAIFGVQSHKAMAIEARLLALRHMVRRGHAPAWLAPAAMNNGSIGVALLEAAADEPLLFNGKHFHFDSERLCSRMLMASATGGQA